MIVRLILGLTVALIALMFIYAPANHTAEQFVQYLASEHQTNVTMWGDRHGERVLDRMQWLRGEAVRNRLPGDLGKPMHERTGAYADQMPASRSSANVSARLMNNEYFRSIDALLLLAMYRLATLIELLPLFLPFLLIAVTDGIADRARRAKEFVPHSPGLYGVFVGGVLATLCVLFVIFAFPGQVNPLFVVATIVMIGLFVGRSISHFLKHT